MKAKKDDLKELARLRKGKFIRADDFAARYKSSGT
jgi:hypothetical protein